MDETPPATRQVPSDGHFRVGKHTRMACRLAEVKIGQPPRGQPFHHGFRHAFRCATKCLGIDAIKLRPSIVTVPASTLVSEWKALADHLADVIAHHPGRSGGRYRQRLLTNSSWKTLLSWCSARRGGFFRRGLRIVATFLQLKRAFPPLPLEMEESALCKHRAVLSSPVERPFDWYDIVDDIIQTHFPQGWARRGPWKADHLPTLVNRAILDGRTARDPTGRAEVCYPTLQRSSAWPLLMAAAESEYDRLYRVASGENVSSSVRAIAVPDAGKFRIITKGRRALKVLEPLQKTLHSHLKKNPCFRYTAEEPTDERIIPTMEEMIRTSRGRFLSVDYSNATDGVDGSFMADLIRRIIDRSGCFEIDCLSKIAVNECMLGREVLYPDGSNIVQARGSLMGSLLSFPLLCLWNESILRNTSFDGHGPTLVNGDDAMKRCTLGDALAWREGSARLGLTPSPGKVYWSDRLITFCSRYYTRRRGRIHRIDHVPVNIMLGEMNGTEYNRIPSRYQTHYKRWCRFNREEFRNLIGPRFAGALGGQGVIGPRDRSTILQHNSYLQKKMLPLLVANATCRPTVGPENALASWIRPSRAFVPEPEVFPPKPKKQTVKRFVPLSSLRLKNCRFSPEGSVEQKGLRTTKIKIVPLPRLAGV